MLASEAENADVNWSFTVRRGGVRTVISEQTGNADLTVVGRMGRSLLQSNMGSTVRHLITRGSGLTMILQEGLELISPVMAVYTGSELSRRAVDIGITLARAAGGPLEILIPAGDRKTFTAMKNEVNELTAEAKVDIISHPVGVPASRGIVSLLQSAYLQPLVLPVDVVADDPDELMLLIDRIKNPVLLVR